MRKILIISVYIFVSTILSGQQVPMYSQYMMNGFLYNPSIAGSEGYTAVNLTARKQWVNITDAPTTYGASFQTRLLKNSYISRSASIKRRRRVMSRSGRVGYGLYVYTDMSGAFSRTGIQATYGYHLQLNNSQLSFGISITGFQFVMNQDKIRVFHENDPLIFNTDKTAFIPDANIGIYFTNKNLYAGLSSIQLFQSSLRLGVNRDAANFKMIRHYFLTTGYRFEVYPEILVEPSFLLKSTEQFISQLDVNVKTYIGENYWIGLSYRSGGSYKEESIKNKGTSAVVMAGVKIDKVYIGYAYDYSFSSIQSRTLGSHEIMIAIKFGDNARRYRWLNRY